MYEKLVEKSFDVLGDRLQESFDISFDYAVARASLKFFDANLIPKPSLIPKEVSDVKFTADLSRMDEISLESSKSNLFKNI
jgi:hypothetical protein